VKTVRVFRIFSKLLGKIGSKEGKKYEAGREKAHPLGSYRPQAPGGAVRASGKPKTKLIM
jgi:hypothetical protein